MPNDPAQIAAQTIREVMAEGVKKHRSGAWEDEDPRMHLLKAQRHIATFLLMLDGHQEPDGENHLKLGLTRTALALAQDHEPEGVEPFQAPGK